MTLLVSAWSGAFFVLGPSKVLSQQDQPGYFIKGEELFKQKRYYEAVQYYEKFLSTEVKITPRSQPFAVRKKVPGKSNLSLHHEAVYHLAESYRHLNNYHMAEKWYGEAMTFSNSAYQECAYWYGVALRANQKYEEAYSTLSRFKESYTKVGPLLTGVDKELENLKFIKKQLSKEKDDYILTPKPIHPKPSAYAMSRSAPGRIVYTAAQENKKDDLILARLYEANDQPGNTEKSIPFQIDQPTDIHNGLATFSKDGKKLFFTRWSSRNGETQSAIYSANYTDTGWTKPYLLLSPINEKGSNSAQPFLTPDGKYLLFSSNREGGVGKYDIWYATLDSNFFPLLVTNAGNIVNTPEDEVTPSYHQYSRTLLFSSSGHIGMGGYDIFSAKGDFHLSNWEKPVNAGKPINSSKDDIYFISTDEDNLWNTGWLSSDRGTDCCLEIYDFRQKNNQVINGKVIDCISREPLEGVKLTVKNVGQNNREPGRYQTLPNGRYEFELRNSSRIEVAAEKEGYQPVIENYTLYFEGGTNSFSNNEICMSPIPPTASEKSQPVWYESIVLAKFSFNQSSLPGSSMYELDSLIAFMQAHPFVIIEVGGHTDGKGSEAYNLKLAQKRVDACLQYLTNKGISKNRLVGKAYGKCCPLVPEQINGNDNPAARQINRRVEYKVINGDMGEPEGK